MAATPQQLATLVQEQQTSEAAALEQHTAEVADGGAGGALAELLAVALAAWITAFGTLAAAGAGAKLVSLLTGLRANIGRASHGLGPRSARVLDAALEDAAALGARHAAVFLTRATGRRYAVPDVGVPEAAADVARTLAREVADQLELAARLLHPRMVSGRGWRGVVVGLAAARRAVSLVRQVVSWAIHRAINGGAAQTATHYGARLLWIAEPTACVRCAAYSGHISTTDGRFPGGLSMDPRSRDPQAAAIDGPPAHPRCRCRAVPWMPGWNTGPGSLPALLQDQALRQIAAGRGRPSESHAARRRAAQALLTRRGLSARVRREAAATAAGRT
ncbi:hypothetical protein ACIA6D_23545 [Streptomyces cacaoi]